MKKYRKLELFFAEENECYLCFQRGGGALKGRNAVRVVGEKVEWVGVSAMARVNREERRELGINFCYLAHAEGHTRGC